MAIAWVVLGVLLLAVELHHLAFYALFGAVAAFVAAIVALVAPGAIAAQAVVAVGVTAAGIVTVRPFVSRALHRHRPGDQVALGVHGGLVGQEVLTLDTVGDVHQPGHVRLAGERWLAVTPGTPLPAGQRAIVTEVRGTTLVVWATDWSSPLPPAGADRQPPRAAGGGTEEESR